MSLKAIALALFFTLSAGPLMAARDSSCEPIPTGSEVDFWSKSPTGISRNYRLRRVADDHYKVTIGIHWLEEVPGGVRQTTPEEKRQWTRSVQQCLNSINDLAFGPSGEKLTFAVREFSQNEYPTHPWQSIMLTDKMFRANSTKWPKDVDCATQVHELLHLTGLVDEYSEPNSTDPYDCRKLYNADSIMSDHTRAFGNVNGSKWLVQQFCEGSPETVQAYNGDPKDPQQKIKVLNSCPAGTTPTGLKAKMQMTGALQSLYEKGFLGTFPTPIELTPERMAKMIPIFNMTSAPPQKKNILEARHFNAIVFPDCLEKNQEYYENAINAYRTSKEKGGEGCFAYPWIGL